jgi:hypothetical protein
VRSDAQKRSGAASLLASSDPLQTRADRRPVAAALSSIIDDGGEAEREAERLQRVAAAGGKGGEEEKEADEQDEQDEQDDLGNAAGDLVARARQLRRRLGDQLRKNNAVRLLASAVSKLGDAVKGVRESAGDDVKDARLLSREAAFKMLPTTMDALLRVWAFALLASDGAMQRSVIELLEPVMQYYPERLVGACLHTWQKELAAAIVTRLAQVPSAPIPADTPSTLATPELLACDRHEYLMDILKRLRSCTPRFMIGSLGPLAVSIMRSSSLHTHPTRFAPVPDSVQGGSQVIPALRLRDSSVFHFLDTYIRYHCGEAPPQAAQVGPRSGGGISPAPAGDPHQDPKKLLEAWEPLRALVQQAASASDHPFTFLWLLGCLSVFVRKVATASATIPDRTLREMQEVMQQTLATVALMANQTVLFSVVADAAVAGAHVALLPAAVDDEDDGDEEEESDLSVVELPWLRVRAAVARALESEGVEVASLATIRFIRRPMSRASNAPILPRVGLLALRTLALVVDRALLNLWGRSEADRANIVVSAVVAQLVPVLEQHHNSLLPLAHAASAVFAALSAPSLRFTLRSWKREAWALFMRRDFFVTDAEALGSWRAPLARIITEDKTLLAQVVERASAQSNINALLLGRDGDLLQRAAGIKRLGFLLLSGRVDQYARHLPVVMERLVEAWRSAADSVDVSQLHADAFLCARVVIARVSAEHLTAVWPTVLSELIRVFQSPRVDSSLLLAASKVIDLALLLMPAQFFQHQWMFLRDPSPSAASRDPAPRNSELPTPGSAGDGAESKVERDWVVIDDGALFHPYLERFGAVESQEPPRESLDAFLRAPLLQVRALHSQHELARFHQQLVHVIRRRVEAGVRPPELPEVDRVLLSDFVELPP